MVGENADMRLIDAREAVLQQSPVGQPREVVVVGEVLDALLDHLAGLDLGVDQDRIGLMGISMGAIYGPRAAAYEKRIKALVGLAGPYNLGECWDALNPLTRGGYRFYTKSADDEEARRKAGELNLRGVLGEVSQPMLVIHGSRDCFTADERFRHGGSVPRRTEHVTSARHCRHIRGRA